METDDRNLTLVIYGTINLLIHTAREVLDVIF